MMTDPIADMLTRIRNAAQSRHRWVDMPPARQKVAIAELLKAHHFVFDHKVLDDGAHGVLRIYLKYYQGESVIRHIERVSRPGRRRYVAVSDIPRVRNGLGIAIVSTSRGLLSDRAARAEGVGGELLALIW
jgi:small subunit ribosomal protein S8